MHAKQEKTKKSNLEEMGVRKHFLKKEGAKMQIFQKTGVLESPGMQVEGLHAIFASIGIKMQLRGKTVFLHGF